MLQGTGSDVGKSVLAAGLCRAFVRRGLTVRPFKPQNMSNNAAVTADGGEIGRAQALQARACGVPPSIHMNPVLLKPEAENGSQVVVHGKRLGSFRARDFWNLKPDLMPAVIESFGLLEAEADLVIVEGAGSAAEINLRSGDIANMGFADARGIPVILVADIDRGGVIANLVGTHAILPADDAAHVAGYIINKFRGDVALFDGGLAAITERTGWASIGVVPWFDDAYRLPAEDSVGIEAKGHSGAGDAAIKIAVPMFPRIANHDDLDPLAMEPDVSLVMVRPGEPLPGDADLIVLPGSKSTIRDLRNFKEEEWDLDLMAHLRRGGHVLGLCGGYQMLGTLLSDPKGIEGMPGIAQGLHHLELQTMLTPDKRLEHVEGVHLASGASISGYEMHIGETTGIALKSPFLKINGRDEGAISEDGRVMGTYVHGLFAGDDFRHAFLTGLRSRTVSGLSYEHTVEATLDALADHLEASLDLDGLLRVAKTRRDVMQATQ